MALWLPRCTVATRFAMLSRIPDKIYVNGYMQTSMVTCIDVCVRGLDPA